MSKLPPQNIEAETQVLGSLLLDPDAVIKIADILTADDFYVQAHGDIYEAMLELYEKREPTDIVSVTNRLKEKNQLEAIGGYGFITSLADNVSTTSQVVYHAKIIQKKSTLRKLQQAAAEITQFSFDEEDEIDELLDKSEQKLFQVSQKYLKQNFIPIKSILTETFDRIDQLHKESGKLRGLPTGYRELDGLLAGLQRSDLVILAARPSVGKTTLALDIVRNAATRHRARVGIFSLEMSKDQLVDRLLCAQAGVDMWKMRTGRLSDREDDDDFPRIGQAMGVLSEAQIFIDDSASPNIMEIRTKARRLKSEHGLDLLVVDYLQLLEGRTSENRVQEVSDITRSLKAIARELNVPVLALSQLSRAVEARSPAIPKLADLRESGSIEQDADVVLFIYRKIMDRSRECPEDERRIAEIHLAKHRNGPTGTVNLFFDEGPVSFKSLEREYDAAPALESGPIPSPALPQPDVAYP